jgi:mRNA interferase MazF
MYIKHFLNWIKIKEKIDTEEKVEKFSTEVVRKGEIRWAIIGVNIGREMDGKGENFARPVLIIHTIGDSLALIIPLTSKRKTIPGYLDFDWQENKDSLCLHQMRIISTKRLLKRLIKISDSKLNTVKQEIKKFYNF